MVVKKGDGSNNVLTGTSVNDQLYGNGGDDVLHGHSGLDTLWGGSGKDTIFGDGGNDTISGDDGNDSLFGGSGDDWLKGGNNNDVVHGDDGNDLLRCSAGNDKLFGDDGNDVLFSDGGNDSLYGGAGNDVYQYTSGILGFDTIFDASGGADKIEFLHATLSDLFKVGGFLALDMNHDGKLDGLALEAFDHSSGITILNYFDNTSGAMAHVGPGDGYIESLVFSDHVLHFSDIQHLF